MAPGSNESENVSPGYRAAPSSPSEIAGSEDSNSYPEGAAEEAPAKLPGFGIISGILGIMVCLALGRKS